MDHLRQGDEGTEHLPFLFGMLPLAESEPVVLQEVTLINGRGVNVHIIPTL